MTYPTGPLLATLAARILTNLNFIEEEARSPNSATQNEAPYPDTQLLISLLGVLVFPHERNSEALGNLLRDYEALGRVVKVQYPVHEGERVELTNADGEAVLIDPADLKRLPDLLRNCVAHFNMLPSADKQGRFCGIRVWNRTPKPDRLITFVADIDFDELRPLAQHVLTEMRKRRTDDSLEDPHDPMDEVRKQLKNPKQPKRKVPGLNRDIWDRLVEGHGGDELAAQTTRDQVLMREAKRLLADQKRGP
jgi:hypothetical protein